MGVKIALLSASPRPEGNSRALADAFCDGAQEAGHDVTLVDLNQVATGGFLRDCRRCRRQDGSCAISDDYADLIHQIVAPADATVLATPLYFYGLAGVLKNYIDRLVCYLSASYPRAEQIVSGLAGQRSALLVATEEDYPTLLSAVTTQINELSHYLQQDFVDVVHGVGNRRGEIRRDPADPIAAARLLGEELFTRRHSDFTVTTVRSGNVWS